MGSTDTLDRGDVVTTEANSQLILTPQCAKKRERNTVGGWERNTVGGSMKQCMH